MTNAELADKLEWLLKKAPPAPWFQMDERCYLHYSPTGELPKDLSAPWQFPVVGRFDYGPCAMELIEFMGNNAPAIIEALRKP